MFICLTVTHYLLLTCYVKERSPPPHLHQKEWYLIVWQFHIRMIVVVICGPPSSHSVVSLRIYTPLMDEKNAINIVAPDERELINKYNPNLKQVFIFRTWVEYWQQEERMEWNGVTVRIPRKYSQSSREKVALVNKHYTSWKIREIQLCDMHLRVSQ